MQRSLAGHKMGLNTDLAQQLESADTVDDPRCATDADNDAIPRHSVCPAGSTRLRNVADDGEDRSGNPCIQSVRTCYLDKKFAWICPMDLRRLRYFIVTAEEMHVGRAAERLNIAQPALSQQIKVLENTLGVRLFHRVRRGIELTDAGKAFLPEVRAAIAQADKAFEIARGVARGETGCIAIGHVGSAMMEPHLPRLLGLFRRRFKDVEVRLIRMPVDDQVTALTDGRLDVGFIRADPQSLGGALRAVPFSRSRLVAVVPADLALPDGATLRALAGQPFIVLQETEREGYFAHVTAERCAAAGFCPTIALRVADVFSLIGLAASGQGVGFVPDLLSDLPLANVRFHSFPELAAPIELHLVSRARSLSPAVRNLVAMAASLDRGQGFPAAAAAS